jgi:hypothetical protein
MIGAATTRARLARALWGDIHTRFEDLEPAVRKTLLKRVDTLLLALRIDLNPDGDMTEIEALRAIVADATPIRDGWRLRVKDDGEERYDVIGEPCGFPVATFGHHADAAFYVACRRLIPRLLCCAEPAAGEPGQRRAS